MIITVQRKRNWWRWQWYDDDSDDDDDDDSDANDNKANKQYKTAPHNSLALCARRMNDFFLKLQPILMKYKDVTGGSAILSQEMEDFLYGVILIVQQLMLLCRRIGVVGKSLLRWNEPRT